MNFFNDLNKHQLEAATTNLQNVRIIAGAGSGKTRVLTYRIAYLLSELRVPAWKILAITFTNKVAAEMQNRVASLYPDASRDLTIKTFHSFSAMFLRKEISVLGYPSSFSIYDEEDQTKLIKDIASDLGYKKNDPIIKKAKSYISKYKNLGIEPDEIKIDYEKFEGEKDCLEIYTIYEEEKKKMLALDFDDLLLKANQILERYPLIREKWQRKIDYILIDEFQDTNNVEYKLIRYLLKPSTSLYVVGDPDQTIYTWRGANQKIILDLEKDFPNMGTIILDRNYRSTQTILDSANKLISNNKFRVEKDLYTENNKGLPIVAKVSSSIPQEAQYVIREIMRLHEVEKVKYKDIVILYRSNFISMDFETALTQNGIPYRIYGGLKFYQRREIKDVLAYFNLIINEHDDVSFERIINVPKRGVGTSSLTILKKEANEASVSMYEYLKNLNENNSELPIRVINSLKSMIKIIELTRNNIKKNEEVFSKILEDMLSSLNYYSYLSEDEYGDDRLDNVKALFEDLRRFLERNPESTFDEYLQNIALVSAQDELVDGDYITMMTVHTAKGLEFPNVFVVRFNQGIFPHNRSLEESGLRGLEEERRLAYVAMTRAKERLYLTSAKGYSYTSGGELVPSQFYLESGNGINDTQLNMTPYNSAIKKNVSSIKTNVKPSFKTYDKNPKQSSIQTISSNGVSSWSVGDTVIHKTLGRGKVISLEGNSIIKVNFDEHGIKSILSTHPAVKKGD